MKARALLVVLVMVVATYIPEAQEQASTCAVTSPVEADLPPSVRSLPSPGGRLWYISPDRAIWAMQPVTRIAKSDGEKFGLLWIRPDANIPLVVTARRTDADAPQIRAQIPTTLGAYVASEMTFPTAGCWEIAATSNNHRLAFVMRVEPPAPPAPPTDGTQRFIVGTTR
jgi:hypothetical protein